MEAFFMRYIQNCFIHLHPYKDNKKTIMTVLDLAKMVSEETGEPVYKIKKIIHVTISIIRREIIRGQIVKLRNLITLFIDVVQETNYYNMNTKKTEKLPRRFVLKVEQSAILKKQINAKKTY